MVIHHENKPRIVRYQLSDIVAGNGFFAWIQADGNMIITDDSQQTRAFLQAYRSALHTIAGQTASFDSFAERVKRIDVESAYGMAYVTCDVTLIETPHPGMNRLPTFTQLS